jgi:hypothetical protein
MSKKTKKVPLRPDIQAYYQIAAHPYSNGEDCTDEEWRRMVMDTALEHRLGCSMDSFWFEFHELEPNQ